DQTLLSTYDYDIWGNPKVTEEADSFRNAFRYAGEYWDSDTGLQYLRARWYDPSTGRFITEDTWEGRINHPDSQNPYVYVVNNPLRYVDPSGLKAEGYFSLEASADFFAGASVELKINTSGEVTFSAEASLSGNIGVEASAGVGGTYSKGDTSNKSGTVKGDYDVDVGGGHSVGASGDFYDFNNYEISGEIRTGVGTPKTNTGLGSTTKVSANYNKELIDLW
ncbi:RHS repeat-associated core domain-containing protein, partial [Paenibacillus spiritus]